MNKNKYLRIFISTFIMSLGLFAITACSNGDVVSNDAPASKAVYEQITSEQAKNLMDTQTNYIILDTRTDSEFAQGHIKDAILIPYDEIAEQAGSKLPDKNQLILVYCRSGNRSKKASQTLAELGYTNVKEFGGIIDWQYEIVK
ncbi:MAG: rhodanese-like domain-containing protein [Ruminococcus sp.]|nr:rhodanese-like domain-containing protein [Ruminococcus sp.]